MDEIPQINLETTTQRAEKIEVEEKTKSAKFNLPKKKLGIILGVLGVLGLLVIFGFILPARNIYSQAVVALGSVKLTYQSVKNQDIEKANKDLISAKGAFLKLQKEYKSLAWMRFLPFLGNYWSDGDHLLKAGLAGLEAGEVSVEAIKPYADLLGLKGKSTFVSKSTDERIQTAVATLDKLTPKLGQISSKLEIVSAEIKNIDPNHYPGSLGKLKPRSQIAELRNGIETVTHLFVSARPLVAVSPDLLGQTKTKRYLILFQNDKELRPTGGFITAYAVFLVNKGKITVESADDIYKLDRNGTTKFLPPQPFMDHLNVFRLYIRDANFEPDFVTSMKQFEALYNPLRGNSDYDGIVALDTHVLVSAMKILGPIPAYGTNFTTEPDTRCGGCPNVIYELEDLVGRRVNYIREDRKDIIGVLLYQIMQKALGVSPGQYWGQLFQMALTEAEQKHILVYLHDSSAQKGITALNMAGQIKDYQGDYLYINDANLGGAKSNMFVTQTVKEEYQTAPDGTITKTLTVEYKNPETASAGCNLETGGVCLNGIMPNWVRVYVPKGSQLIEFKGSEDKVKTSVAYGKTVFEGFLTVKPLGTSQVVVKYKLSVKAQKGVLPVLIQKQPGTDGNEYKIFVNGKQIDQFNLTTDRETQIKL